MEQNLYLNIIDKWDLEPADKVSIHDLLTDRVALLLDRSPDKLMTALYLMDVDEKSLDTIFKENTFLEVPSKIAELILEREIQKSKLRKSG